MDAAELKTLVTGNGFPAIPVLIPNDDSPCPPRFEGTLDEFWTAAKALGTKVVFLVVMQMDESDFEREVSSNDVPRIDEDEEDDSYDGENYSVDLEKVLPSISTFRKHVGKDCAFRLIAKGGVAEMEFLLTETWWDEFQEEAEKAIELWMDRRNERVEEVEANSEKKTKELIVSLKTLISDAEFCSLTTQRAMRAYALEKFPELE
jgi:hypothetical protein